jgi:DNA (cytosine-5)-methyltransferase 1
MATPLRILDLFSGIGGFSYAAERIVGGFETVQFVEREPFCQKVLRNHWPDVPIHDDICTYDPAPGTADVVVGGFPCQDISQAGRRAGIENGDRSALFFELLRVVRLVRPRFIVLENVAAIADRDLGIVLGSLAAAGFDAEWACIQASAVGGCHRRDRWWAVAYAGDIRSTGRAKRYSEAQTRIKASQRSNADGLDLDAIRGISADSNQLRLQGADELAKGGPAWEAATARLVPDWRTYLSEPGLRRGDDGLSGRVDRLKALGNAVVPQVAAIPLLRVKELAGR